jgi:hypothetical protein
MRPLFFSVVLDVPAYFFPRLVLSLLIPSFEVSAGGITSGLKTVTADGSIEESPVVYSPALDLPRL